VSARNLHEVIDKEDTKVKTLKISLDENYRSNQYAFVTFQNINFKEREEEIKTVENYLQEHL
jgi:hypothetical protein